MKRNLTFFSVFGVHTVFRFNKNLIIVLFIEFLPANTTSFCQPFDAGIIASIKKRLKNAQFHRLLDIGTAIDFRNMYKTDLKTAMLWMREIWSDLPVSVIKKCWRETGLVYYPTVASFTMQ